ncbi:MAG: hypothetical protein SX243_07085 [Acidobacteriota bacterium]|nr:hypothetical protein [Acidobacteriota bacterium]
MATKALRFTVLDVGQGTGNFIELFSTKTPGPTTAPTKTFLIDLGSEKQKNEAGGPSAAFVVTQLDRMTNPELDCVILSHSDSDHINLLERVLAAFDPPGTINPTKRILTVQRSYYGGDYKLYSKSGKNVLVELAKYTLNGIGTFPTNKSSFGVSSPAPFRTIDGVDLYLMVGNAPRSAAAAAKKSSSVDSFAINTKSLVVVVSWGIQYIATGDATGVTLAACNKFITPTIKSTFLPQVLMVTMPHHGSETTTFNFTGSGGGRDDADAVRNVETFAANIAPQTITASAERKRTFKHPSAFLLQFFWPFIRSGDYTDPTLSNGRHYYVAYFNTDDGYTYQSATGPKPFPPSNWWYTMQTANDLFTNLYFDPDMVPDKTNHYTALLPPNPGQGVQTPSATPYPPLGVAWYYLSPEGDSTTIGQITNRPSLLALEQELLTEARAKRGRAEATGASTGTRTEAPGGPAGGLRRWPRQVVALGSPEGVRRGRRGGGAVAGPKVAGRKPGGGPLAGLKVLP